MDFARSQSHSAFCIALHSLALRGSPYAGRRRETRAGALGPQSSARPYLNVNESTLWRWKRDPALNFPRARVINGLEYNDLYAVDAWMSAADVEVA
jgi:hypothetical protein